MVKRRSSLWGRGLGHWILQRVSGILLAPLVLWFCLFFLPVLVKSEGSLTSVLHATPWAGIWLILWTLFSFYHGSLGMQVILEDYVTKGEGRGYWIWMIHGFSALFCLWVCLKLIYLGS